MALTLAQTLGLSLQPPPPSDKLFRLVSIAKQFVDDPEREKESALQVFNFLGPEKIINFSIIGIHDIYLSTTSVHARCGYAVRVSQYILPIVVFMYIYL